MMANNEVIGNLLGMTTPTEVTIRIDPGVVRKTPLRLGEHLTIDYQCEDLKELVFASVAEIGLENLNMPGTILTSPREFKKLAQIGDLSDGEVLTAKARILGYLNKKNELEMPRFSPPPGAEVSRAPVELLSKAFGQGHIKIGHLLTNPAVSVKLNVDEIVRRHLAILAITGGGKGNTVAVLVSKILELGGAVVVVDPHSEYLSMRDQLGDRFLSFSVDSDSKSGTHRLRFRYNSFSMNDYLAMLRVPENATNQRALFRDAFKILTEKKTEWDYDNLRAALREADGADESPQLYSLLARLDDTTELAILDKTEEVPLAGSETPGLVNEGCMTTLSLSGLDTDVQRAVVRRVADRILKGAIALRRNAVSVERIPCPVFFIVEESHNFIPSDERATSKPIIQRIASEGRKFGVGLCVVSQRPGKIDSNVLSQCNSMIVLRIVNPRDQANIENSAEALSKEFMQELPSLNVGEAIIFGPAVNLPAVVKIDKYDGKLGGRDIEVVKEWSKEKEPVSKKKGRAQYNDGGALKRRK
jgi:DNA helicase HerA-like ATPase